MKRRNKGKNKVLYVLIALAAVIAAGFIGVRFGLSQGSIRRARMADEASKPESASSGMISAESGKDDGNSDGTSSGEAGTSSDEAVSEAESAETDPEEEERTHSMLAEMSEAAIKEDEIRFREVIRAGVPDVPAYAAAEAKKAAGSKKKKRRTEKTEDTEKIEDTEEEPKNRRGAEEES